MYRTETRLYPNLRAKCSYVRGIDCFYVLMSNFMISTKNWNNNRSNELGRIPCLFELSSMRYFDSWNVYSVVYRQ